MASVTLLSDLGLQDASAGIVKGILYSTVPQVHVTDITHEVAPFSVSQAAYILGSVYDSFPQGTVHLVLTDVFYTSGAVMLLASYAGHYFLVPDNGVLPLALGTVPDESWLCYGPVDEDVFDAWVSAAAAIIARLAISAPAGMGLQPRIPYVMDIEAPRDGDTVRCRILYIDNFGNIVTDMTHSRFEKLEGGRGFSISIGVDSITRISAYYADVPRGDALCRFNGKGYLEICVHRGNASALLGFRVGGLYNDIKIQFG